MRQALPQMGQRIAPSVNCRCHFEASHVNLRHPDTLSQESPSFGIPIAAIPIDRRKGGSIMNIQTIILHSLLGLSLTIGATATLPGRALAQGSDGLTKDEVRQLVANAKTVADHEKLASHFEREAAQFEAKRVEHEEMLNSYNKNRQQYRNKFPSMADHCRALIRNATNSRDNAVEMAKVHREMATGASHGEHQHQH